MTRVAIGRDIESPSLLQFANGFQGTATTAPTATTFTTDGVNIPVNSVVGQYIVTTSGAIRFGIIQSNTSAANSVLTIDRWYDASALPATSQHGRGIDTDGGRLDDRAPAMCRARTSASPPTLAQRPTATRP
jgi:hypothetical protein